MSKFLKLKKIDFLYFLFLLLIRKDEKMFKFKIFFRICVHQNVYAIRVSKLGIFQKYSYSIYYSQIASQMNKLGHKANINKLHIDFS